MLEFIVLGQVPGTHFVVTFNWLLAIVAIALMVYDIRHITHRRNTNTEKTKLNEKISV